VQSTVVLIWVVFLVIGLAVSFAVASYTQRKGYSFALAFVGCFVVSPIVVWLIVALMASRDSRY
jgi:predicted PurR-regulated permease PerM